MATTDVCTQHWKFQHEVEEFQHFKGEADCQRKFDLCKKNPGHTNFIPVSDLEMDHLPPKLQTDRHMNLIRLFCNRTVKVHLSYTSKNRPLTFPNSKQPYPFSQFRDSRVVERCGTGYINEVNMLRNNPCLCKECEMSEHPVTDWHVKVTVHTARHVVFDQLEAVETVCECFYDTSDRTGVKFLYGVNSTGSELRKIEDDVTGVICYSHDRDLVKRLFEIDHFHHPVLDMRYWTLLGQGFSVSHPHGVQKHISFGHECLGVFTIIPYASRKHPGFVKCRLNRPSCTDNAPISICQDEGEINQEHKIYSETITSPSMVEPGIEYLLPERSRICIPYHDDLLHYSKYSTRYHYDDWPSLMSYYDNQCDSGDFYLYCREEWFKLPEGSGYLNVAGDLVYFPQGMEIFANLFHISNTYRVPTCPGSSGAIVSFSSGIDKTRDLIKAFIHTGSDEVVGNIGCPGVRVLHEHEDKHDYIVKGTYRKQFRDCRMTPGHPNYIPVCRLKMWHLPSELQTDEDIMHTIKKRCNLTVRVHVCYTSPHKPDITHPESNQRYPYSFCEDNYLVDRCGTGYIFGVSKRGDDPCPCRICCQSGHPVNGYMEVKVRTPRHVVYNKLEAVGTVCECFYDTPDRTGVKFLYGVDIRLPDCQEPKNDVVFLDCVSHDMDLMKELVANDPSDDVMLHDLGWHWFEPGFTVSHPHGINKHVAFGHRRFCVYNTINCDRRFAAYIKCRLSRPPCTSNAPISQCQEERKEIKKDTLYIRYDTSPSMITPDIEVLLKDFAKICIPCDRELPDDDDVDGDDYWCKLPEGSGQMDGVNETIPILAGLEINARLSLIPQSYDKPICPYSSATAVSCYDNIDDRFGTKFVLSDSDEEEFIGNNGCPWVYDFDFLHPA